MSPFTAHTLRLVTLHMSSSSWQYKLFDDGECLEYVSRHFSQYFDVYVTLHKPVERSDFFRYLWLLGDGGMWADIDTEALSPLDQLLHCNDTLVVGIERDHITEKIAKKFGFGRRPVQLCQWAMAAAPGHAALQHLVDTIASHVRTGKVFSNNSDLNVILKTGPAPWTDAVLLEAAAGRARIVPEAVFAGRSPAPPGAVCIHHFKGTWRQELV